MAQSMKRKRFYAIFKNRTVDLLCESLEDAKEYFKERGEMPDSIIPAKGKHICGYCHKVTDGSDKNLLCDRCRELFGHSFYSEL